MADLEIERFVLHIEAAAGHEHRIEPIVVRAITLLSERLDDVQLDTGRRLKIERMTAPATQLNLNVMSDEQVASHLAASWLEMLVLKLRS
jgi:hypothetical protein